MSNQVYQIITDRIIEKLKTGNIPWQKGWTVESQPRNYKSKKLYRGINTFLLMGTNYALPYFLSFKQAQELGGHVRKGEKGHTVIFWKMQDFLDKENGELKKFPLLRYYTVFNASQIDGVDFPKPETFVHDPIAGAEAIIDKMPKRPELISGNHAAYFPSLDQVMMPDKPYFRTAEDFYSTFFHELTHSTGHKIRLDRPQSILEFNRQGYAREELVAEMGAAFLCGQCGIVERTIENSAAYVQGWLQALKNDPKMVVVAAAQAQKAADYILGQKSVGE